MWGRRQRKQPEEARPTESAGRLKEALRKARTEQADRTGGKGRRDPIQRSKTSVLDRDVVE